jgi:ssDNA-binding Zn-finger/Zn-ribbon topoisomerase 1
MGVPIVVPMGVPIVVPIVVWTLRKIRWPRYAKICKSNSLAKSFKTNIQHTKHVKNIIAEKEQPKEPACPKCGSSMVKRKARKGKYAGNEFYGCPTYPKCRGMIKDSN